MDLKTAIQDGFKNWLDFSGRTSRAAYWYWFLFGILAAVIAAGLDHILLGVGQGPISALLSLALLIPGLSISVRRLHDLDKSGWWILLWLIPLIGFIVLLVWFCTRGTAGANRFGPEPTA